MEHAEALNVIYIRHAHSKYNLWDEMLSDEFKDAEYPEEAEDISELKHVTGKRDFRLHDSTLTKKGISQASTKMYHSFPIKYVFCSPLRRVLETTYLLFGNHPNKPKLVVHPLLREIMNLPNDVPYPLQEIEPVYEEKGFDFSLLKLLPQPQLHFLYTLNSPDKEQLLEAIEHNPETSYLNIIESHKLRKRKFEPKHFHRVETYANIRKRAKDFAAFLKSFIKESGCSSNEIAVVTHGEFIKYTTTTEYSNEHQKVASKPIKNCSYISVDINKLVNDKY